MRAEREREGVCVCVRCVRDVSKTDKLDQIRETFDSVARSLNSMGFSTVLTKPKRVRFVLVKQQTVLSWGFLHRGKSQNDEGKKRRGWG